MIQSYNSVVRHYHDLILKAASQLIHYIYRPYIICLNIHVINVYYR